MFTNKADKEKIQVLEKKIKELEDQINEISEIRNSIGYLFEESIPQGETQRKRYMADIALFHSTIFKDKLKHFIGLQMEELAKVDIFNHKRSEFGDLFIRASISVFRLIDEWMTMRSNEHLGNLEEMRKRFKNDKEFINNFKKTYGQS